MNKLVLLMATAIVSFAQQATVSRVVDGDTFAVNNLNGQSETIRMNCIDAPESSQEHGVRATVALRNLINGRMVTLQSYGKDKYGRILADVYVDSQLINLRMVDEGHAWMYREYCKNDVFSYSESKARAAKVGLWSASEVMAPWGYRRGQGIKIKTELVGTQLAAIPVNATVAEATSITVTSTEVAPEQPATPKGQAHIETKADGSEVWRSSGSANGRTVHTGPRGGKYTISPSGRKVYVPKSRR